MVSKIIYGMYYREPRRPPKPTKPLDSPQPNRETPEPARSHTQSSRLLELPQHLRTRIYALVLGGNTIYLDSGHMDWAEEVWPHALTCTTKVTVEHFAGLYASEAATGSLSGEVKEHLTEHTLFKKESDTKADLTLSLLQTCRQVHSEAALLPFSLNDFICTAEDECEYPSDLHLFSKLLLPVQRAAIRTLQVHASEELQPLPSSFGLLFPNVQTLTIFMPGDELQDPEARFQLLRKFETLCKWPLESAHVIIYRIRPDSYGGSMVLSEAAAISAQMESLLSPEFELPLR